MTTLMILMPTGGQVDTWQINGKHAALSGAVHALEA